MKKSIFSFIILTMLLLPFGMMLVGCGEYDGADFSNAIKIEYKEDKYTCPKTDIKEKEYYFVFEVKDSFCGEIHALTNEGEYYTNYSNIEMYKSNKKTKVNIVIFQDANKYIFETKEMLNVGEELYIHITFAEKINNFYFELY